MVKEEEFGQSVPVDPYGAYKYECSKVIQQSETMIDLRMFGVFGKYEDIASRFISHAICRALLDLPIAVIQNVKFEYLYVNDFVKVVEHFVANPNKHKAYNVGNGQPVDLLTIAKKIEKISAKVLDISVNTPGYNKEYTCDNSRLMSELGNFEFTPLDSALLELYNWYKEHLGEIDKSKLV